MIFPNNDHQYSGTEYVVGRAAPFPVKISPVSSVISHRVKIVNMSRSSLNMWPPSCASALATDDNRLVMVTLTLSCSTHFLVTNLYEI
jgi:hypothetical protein